MNTRGGNYQHEPKDRKFRNPPEQSTRLFDVVAAGIVVEGGESSVWRIRTLTDLGVAHPAQRPFGRSRFRTQLRRRNRGEPPGYRVIHRYSRKHSCSDARFHENLQDLPVWTASLITMFVYLAGSSAFGELPAAKEKVAREVYS